MPSGVEAAGNGADRGRVGAFSSGSVVTAMPIGDLAPVAILLARFP